MFIISEDYFVKYRKEWLSKYDNFILLVYIYLYRFNSIEHYVPVTIKDIVSYFKFTPDRNKGRVNDKFKTAINQLINMEFVSFVGCNTNKDVTTYTINSEDKKDVKYLLNDNDMFWLKLINFDDVKYWNPSGDFVKFNYSELDTILNIDDIKNVDKIASTYMNIKKWISVTESETSRFVAFPSENQLSKDIGCSTKSIQGYINQLLSAKMIYKKNYGSFKRLQKGEEIKQNANTVYALEEKYLDGKYDKDHLKSYLQSNYQMIGDDFEPFNQPLNEYQKKDDKMDDISEDTDLVITDNVIDSNTIKASGKVDMNPFHEDSSTSVEEDEMQFDTSGMNPNIEPYKPFGGAFEDVKKQKSIRDMNVEEFFNYMDWMGNKKDDDEDFDIESIFEDDSDDVPESIKMTRVMMEEREKDNSDDYVLGIGQDAS